MPRAAAAAITVPVAALARLLRLINNHGPLYSHGLMASVGLGRLLFDSNILTVCCSEDEDGRWSQIDNMKKIFCFFMAMSDKGCVKVQVKTYRADGVTLQQQMLGCIVKMC